jgi:hypothetical protein
MSQVGFFTSSVYQLQRMVSESAAFQERRGLSSAAEALPHVKVFEYEATAEEIRKARPFACVWTGDKFEASPIGAGAAPPMRVSGDVVLILTDNDRFPGDREKSADDFIGWIDLVFADLLEKSGVDDRLSIQGVTLLQRPSRTPTAEEATAGAFWDAAFSIHWF